LRKMWVEEFWANIYQTTLVDLQWSETTLFVVGSFLCHEIPFMGLNLLLYIFHRYSLFEKYRIRKHKYPDQKLINECLKSMFINHFLLQWPLVIIIWNVFRISGIHFAPTLPPLSTILFHMLLFILIEDFLFYWSHRLLHHPSIYKHIHKQHHEFKSTIGIASEYAHPVEAIVSNLVPFLAGPLLVKSHVFTFWVWTLIRMTETVDAHSGYKFPFSPFSLLPFQGGSERHEYHHFYNIGSYGSFFLFWDWVCGTDVSFKQHQLSLQNKKTS